MGISYQIVATFLVFFITIWGTKSHHIIEECEDFQTGITNSTQDPLSGPLYTQAYRNIAGNTNNGVQCCRFIGTPSTTSPGAVDVQCTFVNTSTNHVCRVNYTLSRESNGVYADNSRVPPTQLEIVLRVVNYGIYLYSCEPSKNMNLIRLVTKTQNPTDIPYETVAQQFQSFGYPGYQNVTQSPQVCTNY